jgi:hypothetical protein
MNVGDCEAGFGIWKSISEGVRKGGTTPPKFKSASFNHCELAQRVNFDADVVVRDEEPEKAAARTDYDILSVSATRRVSGFLD